MSEQKIFSVSGHVFQLDPTTKSDWIPAGADALPIALYRDEARRTTRIVCVNQGKAVINCFITPGMSFLKSSAKFGQWEDVRAGVLFGVGFNTEGDLSLFSTQFENAASTSAPIPVSSSAAGASSTTSAAGAGAGAQPAAQATSTGASAAAATTAATTPASASPSLSSSSSSTTTTAAAAASLVSSVSNPSSGTAASTTAASSLSLPPIASAAGGGSSSNLTQHHSAGYANGDTNGDAPDAHDPTPDAIALYDFTAKDETQVSFKAKQPIFDVSPTMREGWSHGSVIVADNWVSGLFPTSYIQMLSPSSGASSSSAQVAVSSSTVNALASAFTKKTEQQVQPKATPVAMPRGSSAEAIQAPPRGVADVSAPVASATTTRSVGDFSESDKDIIIKHLRDRIEQFEKNKLNAENSSKELIDQLQADVSSLKQENEKLIAALKESNANGSLWETELKTVKQNNARLLTALQESYSNVETWRSQLLAIEEHNAKLQKKLNDLEQLQQRFAAILRE